MAVGLLGGTFDPVHNGHLKVACEVVGLFDLSELRFVPCAFPPHRDAPSVSPQFRAKMVELAIKGEPRFVCDRREIVRAETSYTVKTLVEVREEVGPSTTLIFVMGSDALNRIATWKQWQELLNYAHLVVVDRLGCPSRFSKTIDSWLKANQTRDIRDLSIFPNGFVYPVSLNTPKISATEVRCLLSRRQSVRNLMPESVFEFLQQNDLYLSNAETSSDKSSSKPSLR